MDFREALWTMITDIEQEEKETWEDQYQLGHLPYDYYEGKRVAYGEVIGYIKEILFIDASTVEEA